MSIAEGSGKKKNYWHKNRSKNLEKSTQITNVAHSSPDLNPNVNLNDKLVKPPKDQNNTQIHQKVTKNLTSIDNILEIVNTPTTNSNPPPNHTIESADYAWYCEKYMLTTFPPRKSLKWIDDRCFTLKFTVKFSPDPEVLPPAIMKHVIEEYHTNNTQRTGQIKNYEKENDADEKIFFHKTVNIRISVPRSNVYPFSYNPKDPQPSQSSCPSLEWEDNTVPEKLRNAISRLFTESAISHITSLRDGSVRKPPPPNPKRFENHPDAPSQFPVSFITNCVTHCLNQLDLQWEKLLNFELRLKHEHLLTQPTNNISQPSMKISMPATVNPHRQAVAQPSKSTHKNAEAPANLNSGIKADVKLWAPDEQARLEMGLKLYPSTPDVDITERWKNISTVVKTRSAKQCAFRFKELRDAILAERKALENMVKKEKDDKVQDDVVPENTLELEGREQSMALDELEMNLLGYISLHCANFIVSCSRCHDNGSIKLVLPPVEKLGQSVGGGHQCVKCKTQMKVVTKGALAHQSSNEIARVVVSNCSILDITEIDLETVCEECSAKHLMRTCMPATTRSSNCPQCYKKQSILFASISCGNASTGLTRIENLMKKLEEKIPKARTHAVELGLKAGCALPGNGACEHYKRSFRWLRFPCCGRAFPCDTCHDKTMDHPAEWASKMICGHCSKEQPFTQKSCIHCGDDLQKGATSFWEGGKGCRNPLAMSKKDPKRDKLIGKMIRDSQAEQKKKENEKLVKEQEKDKPTKNPGHESKKKIIVSQRQREEIKKSQDLKRKAARDKKN